MITESGEGSQEQRAEDRIWEDDQQRWLSKCGKRECAHSTWFPEPTSPDGYTFYSVSQERFLDELEDEAKAARARALERASGH